MSGGGFSNPQSERQQIILCSIHRCMMSWFAPAGYRATPLAGKLRTEMKQIPVPQGKASALLRFMDDAYLYILLTL